MTRSAIHPGEHLVAQLGELGLSAAELGRRLKVPTNRITGIVNGQRPVTGDTTLRLAHFFGTSPEFWLNLQKLYELRLAKAKAGATIRRLPRLAARRRPSERKSLGRAAAITKRSAIVAGIMPANASGWNRSAVLDEAESLRRSLKVKKRVNLAALIGTGRR